MTHNPKQQDAAHWESYWQNAQPAPAAASSGAVTGEAQSRRLWELWRGFFESELAHRRAAVLLDLACGAGVVLRQAMDMAKGQTATEWRFTGVDYSMSAATLNHLNDRQSVGANGVVASVSALPLKSHSIDIAVSQFGLEYAGVDAFCEAGRVLAPGGVLSVIAHYRGGAIEIECLENLSITRAIEESGLLAAARRVFAGESGGQQVQNVMQAFDQLKPLGGEKAPAVAAKELLIRLCTDIARMVQRRAAFAPNEVLAWIDGMEREVGLYGKRMEAMAGAAVDHTMLMEVSQRLERQEVMVHEPQVIKIGDAAQPAAWRFEARREE